MGDQDFSTRGEQKVPLFQGVNKTIMKNHEIINVAYCILFFLFFGDYTLIILTRPVVAFCISSVFEGLTIFETNPDIDIYKRYIYI